MELDDLRFDESHTWVRDEGNEVVIGITDYAQDELGEIIFCELPEVGAEIKRGEAFGSVESAKAVEDLIAPISGVVTRRNDEVVDAPETINEDPYGEGWLLAVKPSEEYDPNELLTYEQYLASLELAEEDDDYEDLDLEEDDELFLDDE
ncbi:MAG: glycine cleavage system protein GcvH [Armatimonadetes bacterium]|nr:glycine cleavage system protein GcvH [Armatimonadota bacterium]